MRAGRILIVDDEPGIRQSLTGVLQDEGFEVHAVASGEECLAELARRPIDAVLLFDVRFLPNPYFVPELKPYPGTDPRVAGFVLGKPEAQEFLDRIHDLLGFLLPRYREEGKSYLTVAIGCTGGKHRSVALSAALAERLEKTGQPVRLWHRDVEKE